MHTTRRRRVATVAIVAVAVAVGVIGFIVGRDRSDPGSAPATETAPGADAAPPTPSVVILDSPSTVRGTGLNEIDIGSIVASSPLGVRFSLPAGSAAYLLDADSRPIESILAGSFDSATGTLLVGDLARAQSLQVDADGDWAIRFLDDPGSTILDRVITGSGNEVVRLGAGVVEVVIEGGGCPSGLEISSWTPTELLAAELFVDDELPAVITPPDGTVLINVRGPCAWSLTPR